MNFIPNFWPVWFRALLGPTGLPESYVAVDCETSGYSPDQDLITEWGHVFVEDNEVVDRLSILIDWSDRASPPEWWVQERFARVHQSMRLAGKPCHVTFERCKAEGMKPEKAFPFIAQFVATLRNKGVTVVAHNGLFDEKMLSANFLRFGFGKGFTFGDRIFDTAAIEKASQLLDNSRVHPQRNDTLRSYFTRVIYTRVQAGLKWSLDGYAFPKYRLAEKGVTPADLHQAGVDAYCCHLLMQEYRKLLTDPVTPPVYPTADSKEAGRPNPRPLPPMGGPTTPPRRVRGQRCN